ncbi:MULTISPECIES: sigma-70 family RNA polymerase sigma factor [Sorangium]|uniref:RNA polymerase sigma factor n=1 Tax=Sorangium cellulosum TaxID=56 RepID=A0A4P2QW07_SORCE|nr:MULTISPECIES: sigma-70 family RNA polymerase sigma factor [Sorangium]AUX34378.1 RNA polymerase sigma factor [Sorangium cellulosum]WCQ93694.1 RNA polymerase sigma factor [Sorangium sp. Soce836]
MSHDDRAARPLSPDQQALVAQAVPLAEQLCDHFLRRTGARYMADDLRSAAFQALHEAALGYDPARGVPFPAYAWRRIDGALSDALRQESKHWRAARDDAYDAAEAVHDASDVLADGDAETTAQVDGMADEVAAAAVLGLAGRALRAPGEEGERLRATYGRAIRAAEAALSGLKDEERRVLVLHHVEQRTWPAIGAALGCSERTAKRRGAEARKRFAEALRAEREGAQGGASATERERIAGATSG